jgi:hypothetical protein
MSVLWRDVRSSIVFGVECFLFYACNAAWSVGVVVVLRSGAHATEKKTRRLSSACRDSTCRVPRHTRRARRKRYQCSHAAPPRAGRRVEAARDCGEGHCRAETRIVFVCAQLRSTSSACIDCRVTRRMRHGVRCARVVVPVTLTRDVCVSCRELIVSSIVSCNLFMYKLSSALYVQ